MLVSPARRVARAFFTTPDEMYSCVESLALRVRRREVGRLPFGPDRRPFRGAFHRFAEVILTNPD